MRSRDGSINKKKGVAKINPSDSGPLCGLKIKDKGQKYNLKLKSEKVAITPGLLGFPSQETDPNYS